MSARWTHKRGDRYVPIQVHAWMNEAGYGMHHYPLSANPTTHSAAKACGLRMLGHDDFNIGVVRAGRLVAMLWMNEDIGEEPDVLDEITSEIGLRQ